MDLVLETTIVADGVTDFVAALGLVAARDGGWVPHEVIAEAPRAIRVRSLWPYPVDPGAMAAAGAAFIRAHEAKVRQITAWAAEWQAGGWPPLANIARTYSPRSQAFQAWLAETA